MKKNSSSPILVIRRPSPDEEFEFLWTILTERLSTYIDRGWSVSLPDNAYFKKLAQNPSEISSADFNKARKVFKETVFDKSFFNKSIENMEKERAKIESIFPIFKTFYEQWGFYYFPKYEILFTRYGIGGSYLYKMGLSRAIVLANTKGKSNRTSYAQNPIHEFVHTGINETVVKKYNLSQNEKERLVDFICMSGLQSVIPEYEETTEEIPELDKYLNTKALENLPSAIKKYTSEKDSNNIEKSASTVHKKSTPAQDEAH